MGGNLPGIAPAISYHCATVPVREIPGLLDGGCSPLERALVGEVGILDVNVEKRRHLIAFRRATDHDHRIPDPELGRPVSVELPVAPNTCFTNVTSASGSCTTMRGMRMGQPSGL